MSNIINRKKIDILTAIYLYNLVESKTIDEFKKILINEGYDDLERMFYLIKLNCDNPKRDMNHRCDYVRNVIDFIADMHDKEFDLNDDYKIVLGTNYDIDYLPKLECLIIPDELINNNIDKYIETFKKLIESLVCKPINNIDSINDLKLKKLVTVCKDIKNNYFHEYFTWGLVINILIAGIYYNNNYDLIYNFLNNPLFYYDKMNNDGVIQHYPKEKYSLISSESARTILLNANCIFGFSKRIIK